MSDVGEQVFEKNYTTTQLLRDVWHFLSPYKGKVIFATIARLLGDLAWLYPAWALALTIAFCAGWKSGDSLGPIWMIFGLWILATVTRLVGQFCARIFGFAAGERAALDAQAQFIKQLFALDMSWHERENAGNKMKRIERGSDAIDRLLRIWINSAIEVGVNLIGTVVIIAFVDRTIGVITGIFIGVYSVMSWYLLKKARAAAQQVNAKEEELSGAMFEGANNIRTVKVLGMSSSITTKIHRITAEVFDRVKHRIFRFQTRTIVLGSWSNGFKLAVLLAIVFGITRGYYGVSFLIVFNMYFGRVNESVSELSDNVQDFILAKLAIARMQEVLNVPSFPDGEHATRAFPANWQTISVRNLSFSYGGDEVLHNVSFDLRRGERIGLVGLSGAGKSTLFKLLLKENENYTGEILVDDVPLRSVKKSSYYQKATVVLQETEVFNLSLRENILLANPKKKDDASLKKALNIAHVTSFLHRLSQGVETMIGEKGVKLSGGERQRVGIARAVFKEPEVLFLDEATSHLDVESEEKIQDSLHVFFKNVTALVIAHRLTTIKEMDRILVLEGGSIIESGTFAELYDRKGRFFELWEKQKLG
ncbi:MAG: ABC transporter ATP-binding protein [Patescibacteria group bacterium]